ncbi:MAG: hypothetical protein JSS32_10660 [Verrucomicrobia bacterium]|nr:hypothetical protein [Verrucomicrobiota bacterium]
MSHVSRVNQGAVCWRRFMRDFTPLFSLAKKIGDAFLHFFKVIFPCLFNQRPHNPISRSVTTSTNSSMPPLSFSPRTRRGQPQIPRSDTTTTYTQFPGQSFSPTNQRPLSVPLEETQSATSSSDSPVSSSGGQGALTHSRSASDLPNLLFQGADTNGLHRSDNPDPFPQASPSSEIFSPVHSHTLQQQVGVADFSHSQPTGSENGAGSWDGSVALSTAERHLLELAMKRKQDLAKTDSDEESLGGNLSEAGSIDFLADRFVGNSSPHAGTGTRQVHADVDSQQVSMNGLRMPRKKKADLLSQVNRKIPFEPYEVDAASLPLKNFSSGIYCALLSVNKFWDLILTDVHAITEETINGIVESGIKHSSDSYEPERFLQEFPRISHIDFVKMENEEEDKKRKGFSPPTLLKENGAIYGNTYTQRVLQRVEEVHAMADKHPNRIGAAIFLKGAADAPEPFVIFAHRPKDSLDRESCRYFIFDLGATSYRAVFKNFKTRAGVRDYIVARAPVEKEVDPIKGTVDQTNDYTRIVHVKCN